MESLFVYHKHSLGNTCKYSNHEFTSKSQNCHANLAEQHKCPDTDNNMYFYYI